MTAVLHIPRFSLFVFRIRSERVAGGLSEGMQQRVGESPGSPSPLTRLLSVC